MLPFELEIMSFGNVFVRERIEELRSRLSLMESTLSTTEQDFWIRFSSAMRGSICPQILYPPSTFKRLRDFVSKIKSALDLINPDGPVESVLGPLNILHSKLVTILVEVVRLQNVLSQRISGTGIDKILEFQPTSQLEFCILSKAYDAVDALTFELVKRTLGDQWIDEHNYVPISLFDYRGYMINLYSFIISVPYYDSFRSRFWPSLAHEVGHIFTFNYTDQASPLLEIFLRKESEMEELLGYAPKDPNAREHALNQLHELSSDILATYVCPTSFASAASLIPIPFEAKNAAKGALANFVKYTDHPPLDSRLVLMKNVLEATGGLRCDPDFSGYIEEIMMFMETKNMFGLSEESYQFIEKYNEFAITFSNEIIDTLPSMGVKPFNGLEWKTVLNGISTANWDNLSPVQLLTLAWLKRIKTIKAEGSVLIRDYLEHRHREKKTFELVVNSMHKYFEREIISKMEPDWRDLRNHSC